MIRYGVGKRKKQSIWVEYRIILSLILTQSHTHSKKDKKKFSIKWLSLFNWCCYAITICQTYTHTHPLVLQRHHHISSINSINLSIQFSHVFYCISIGIIRHYCILYGDRHTHFDMCLGYFLSYLSYLARQHKHKHTGCNAFKRQSTLFILFLLFFFSNTKPQLEYWHTIRILTVIYRYLYLGVGW